MRLPLELSDAALAHGPHDVPDDWFRSLKDEIVKSGQRPSAGEVTEEDVARWTTQSRRLRWIFRRTMGAADAFSLRKRELERDGKDASDEAVVHSFLEDLGPGGRFRRYLEASCLLHRVGNTLFTHAGLTQENLLRVPGADRAPSLDAWIATMNAWYSRQLEEWRAGCGSWPGHGRRPGEALIEYCQPVPKAKVNQQSVVYSRNADAEGKIALPAPEVMRALLEAGVRRVAVGHTPSGDIPVLLRAAGDEFELLVADTSRATEPEAACLVAIEGGQQRAVDVRSGPHGVLSTGEPLAFRALLDEPSPLGKRRPDGAVVVAPCTRGWMTYQLKPGWIVEYACISTRDLPASAGCEPL
jgi:hypothetical protein